ncbi:MAG TPA: T9SS type A sorting domain-containing protein, partial [Chitinophagaceae bacterium]
TYGRGLFTAIIPVAAFPVTLTDFRGSLKGNNITLHWQTASEQQNKGFEIERSNAGTGAFTRIGFVAGVGNSNTLKQYIFEDKGIAQEFNYYRLKQIDEDGNYEYSKTILIKSPLKGINAFTVLNNPFRTTLDLQFGKGIKGKAAIRLLDITGQTVMQWNGEVQPGNRLRLQVPHQSVSGFYIVQLFVNKEQYTATVRRE